MKKKICSIMGISKKKAGVAIICGVLLIVLGTGLVFAAKAPQAYAKETENTDGDDKSVSYENYMAYGRDDVDASAQEQQSGEQSLAGCAVEEAATPDELAKDYEVYEPFGLTYDKKTNSLYYRGRIVREFLDIKATNGEDLSGGKFSGTISQVCNDYGEININTVRDFTTLDKNGYGKLTGIEVGD